MSAKASVWNPRLFCILSLLFTEVFYFVKSLCLHCPANGLIFTPTVGQQRCYWFESMVLNWDDSNSQCANNGGTLAIVDNADQDSFVLNNVIRPVVPYPEVQYIWIGFHDKYVDGEFWNANGIVQSYFHWAPANQTTDTQCGSINSKHTNWHDLMCHKTKMSLCSKDLFGETTVMSNCGYFTLDKTDSRFLDGNPLTLKVGSSVICACICLQSDGSSFNYHAGTNTCIVNVASTITQTTSLNNKYYIKN